MSQINYILQVATSWFTRLSSTHLSYLIDVQSASFVQSILAEVTKNQLPYRPIDYSYQSILTLHKNPAALLPLCSSVSPYSLLSSPPQPRLFMHNKRDHVSVPTTNPFLKFIHTFFFFPLPSHSPNPHTVWVLKYA